MAEDGGTALGDALPSPNDDDRAATKLQARVRGRNARTTKRVAIAGEPARGRRVRTLGKRFDEKLLFCAVVARADGSVDVEATSLGSARKSIATVRSEDIAELAMQGADEDLSHEDADTLSKRVCELVDPATFSPAPAPKRLERETDARAPEFRLRRGRRPRDL